MVIQCNLDLSYIFTHFLFFLGRYQHDNPPSFSSDSRLELRLESQAEEVRSPWIFRGINLSHQQNQGINTLRPWHGIWIFWVFGVCLNGSFMCCFDSPIWKWRYFMATSRGLLWFAMAGNTTDVSKQTPIEMVSYKPSYSYLPFMTQ